MKKIFLLIYIFFNLTLYANHTLQKRYYYSNNHITPHFLLPNLADNKLNTKTIVTIEPYKNRERIKCKDIVKLLEPLKVSCKYSYIEFIKESPINTNPLKNELVEYYKSYLPTLSIDTIVIEPRSYIQELPRYYNVIFPSKAYRNSFGEFYIIDEKKHKYFFNYMIEGRINILVSKDKIRRSAKITLQNAQIKSLHFNSLKDIPLIQNDLNHYESIHTLQANHLITQRDIKKVFLVKRGDNVNVIIKNGNLVVQTAAIAVQNGRLNDKITIEKSNKERLKAVVIAPDLVQIK